MNEYTPTTEHVRDAYVRAMRNAFIASAGEHEAEFDRWLEQVRAEERERCAQIAESEITRRSYSRTADIAAAIRAVSEQEEN